MGEIKSVKVDNWGVFFLQKLQNFFNKTDYCDLTLQFRDNSQLKVHRLVLSACTDYFNVLEQTCEIIDDALIMPNELQADVVVPIVNFMYTGTLEFELKMYGKLLRTAKEMNMTVLLKLLEAHRRTMENVNRAQRPPSPKAIRRRVPGTVQSTVPVVGQYQHQAQQTRRILTTTNPTVSSGVNVVQRRVVQSKPAASNAPPQVQIQYRQQIGSTSVLRTTPIKVSQQQQHTIQSYIKHEPEEFETIMGTQQPTSPFEQLRNGDNNNTRPATTAFLSPPVKKPNLEDVKEFAEQQRMRKQIADEYGDDQEFEGMMDDDLHNDDDDDDAAAGPLTANASASTATHVSSGRQDPAGGATATITFKQEQDGQPPTIVVKDTSGSKMNHAKIISEVLRQYPHLAKGNKNIKLKIMPNASGQSQKIVIKKEPDDVQPQALKQATKVTSAGQLSSQITIKPVERTTTQNQQTSAAKQPATLPQKASGAVSAGNENPPQKRRIDSKTMHALIALGAENMTGPWLCLRCGVNGRPISIPSYRGFRRHLINTHKETIDAALCEHCGWRSQNQRELHFHTQVEHKIKTTLYAFPECSLCAELFLDTNTLNQHMLTSHPSANKQQCIYCNKIFVTEMQLFTHMKLYHKRQAVMDGIIDASDDELGGGIHGGEEEHVEEEDYVEHETEDATQSARKDAKVKILSDISLPMASTILKQESTEIHSTTIGPNTKFVTADGSEMILSEEQRKEIISQLNQEHNNGGVVMVLNDTIFTSAEAAAAAAAAEAEATASAAEEAASEEEFDDSQIYAELESTQKPEKKKTLDESRESMENLEWAENLITEHELADEGESVGKKVAEDKAKKEHITQKLKELTGDWSEDENDDEDEEMTAADNVEEETEHATTEAAPSSTPDVEAEEKSVSGNIDEDKDGVSSEVAEPKDKSETEIEELEEGAEEKTRTDEPDDLDLAMQNLHGEEIVAKDDDAEKVETVSESKENVDEVEKMDTDEQQTEKDKETENEAGEKEPEEATISTNVAAADETTAATAKESIINATLLDELMAEADSEKALAEDLPESELKSDDEQVKVFSTKNTDGEDDDELLAAELSESAEEFSAIEKDETEPGKLKTAVSVSKNTKSVAKADEGDKSSASASGSKSTKEVKSLGSDWDVVDDDDDDVVGDNEEA